MKQEVGHTYKLIASDAVFNKIAIIYNILLLGTLLPETSVDITARRNRVHRFRKL
ncbi:unnamed protein product [Arabidopsis halleri]